MQIGPAEFVFPNVLNTPSFFYLYEYDVHLCVSYSLQLIMFTRLLAVYW